MAKISNQAAYPLVTNVDLADYLVMTDKDNKLETKTVTVEQLKDLFGVNTLVAHVIVNAGTLTNLGTTAATLIPAPGANKVIDLISIDHYLDAGTAQYNFGNHALAKSTRPQECMRLNKPFYGDRLKCHKPRSVLYHVALKIEERFHFVLSQCTKQQISPL